MSAKYQVIHYSTVTILKILSKEQQHVLKDLFRNLNFKNKRKTPSIYM